MEAEFEALKIFLNDNNAEYAAYNHERIHTAEEAAKVRGVEIRAGVKSIVVKGEAGFFIILVPGNRKIDFPKLPFKAGLADPKDVFRITGCEIGSVHPFGNLFGLRIFMDRHVLDNEIVHFSAGTHNDSISMSPRVMAELIKPEIGDYTVEK